MSSMKARDVRTSVEPGSDVEEFCNLINGEQVRSNSGKLFDNPNPADFTETVGRFQASTAADARAAVDAASAAFEGWKKTSVSRRAAILNRAADHLEACADLIARGMTREMGKALNLARDEVIRSAQTLRFYAVEGQTLTGEVFPNDDAGMTVYTLREPLGVVSVITPWNFPLSIPARKIAPALITGNTVVFKPSSDAPLTGYRLAEALIAGGLPNACAQLHHRQGRRDRPGHHRTVRDPRHLLHRLDRSRRAYLPLGRLHDPHADGAWRQESLDRDG
jgi:alpha-ketoglutaric semialdehyde dehydrogenase